MELSPEFRKDIVEISLGYIRTKWNKDFTCITFIREVYKCVKVAIPPVWGYELPPQDYNTSPENFLAWKEAEILFLKRRKYKGKRLWTHVGIILPEEKLIHCSEYFGGEVSVNTKQEILDFYQYVPSHE